MIRIDGSDFNIPIVLIDMSADMLDKYAERTSDGILHRELIGVYYNFKITFSSSYNNPVEYARLWQKLTEPVEFHTVTLWDEDGEYSQLGYFANTQHRIIKVDSTNQAYFRELTTEFVAKQPRSG